MKCPFLRGAKVKYCRASAYRKLLEAGSSEADRCYSSTYTECRAAAPLVKDAPVESRCPFLQEADAEFCAASAVTKYIPSTNPLVSRCSSDDHSYCEVYLSHADPEGTRRPDNSVAHTQFLEGVPVPADLSYSPNHMWLDVGGDGHCHVGIDGFLAKVIGSVEKVSFATPRGSDRPVAVITVNDVDLQMAFPKRLQHCSANVYLRTTPSKLTDDPYGAGWLFQGVEPTLPWDNTGDIARAGLLRGEAAASWMASEAARLTEFVHEHLAQNGDARSAADGGVVDGGIAAHLGRDDLIDLFHEFFVSEQRRRTW